MKVIVICFFEREDHICLVKSKQNQHHRFALLKNAEKIFTKCIRSANSHFSNERQKQRSDEMAAYLHKLVSYHLMNTIEEILCRMNILDIKGFILCFIMCKKRILF